MKIENIYYLRLFSIPKVLQKMCPATIFTISYTLSYIAEGCVQQFFVVLDYQNHS